MFYWNLFFNFFEGVQYKKLNILVVILVLLELVFQQTMIGKKYVVTIEVVILVLLELVFQPKEISFEGDYGNVVILVLLELVFQLNR